MKFGKRNIKRATIRVNGNDVSLNGKKPFKLTRDEDKGDKGGLTLVGILALVVIIGVAVGLYHLTEIMGWWLPISLVSLTGLLYGGYWVGVLIKKLIGKYG